MGIKLKHLPSLWKIGSRIKKPGEETWIRDKTKRRLCSSFKLYQYGHQIKALRQPVTNKSSNEVRDMNKRHR